MQREQLCTFYVEINTMFLLIIKKDKVGTLYLIQIVRKFRFHFQIKWVSLYLLELGGHIIFNNWHIHCLVVPIHLHISDGCFCCITLLLTAVSCYIRLLIKILYELCAIFLSGKPMKLIYFVSPYDLLDKNSKSAHAMTVEGMKVKFVLLNDLISQYCYAI